MKYIYLLKQKYSGVFKIGTTKSYHNRIKCLEGHWGKFDDDSIICEVRGSAYVIEKYLHQKFSYANKKMPFAHDGHTEFFSTKCFNDVLQWLIQENNVVNIRNITEYNEDNDVDDYNDLGLVGIWKHHGKINGIVNIHDTEYISIKPNNYLSFCRFEDASSSTWFGEMLKFAHWSRNNLTNGAINVHTDKCLDYLVYISLPTDVIGQEKEIIEVNKTLDNCTSQLTYHTVTTYSATTDILI